MSIESNPGRSLALLLLSAAATLERRLDHRISMIKGVSLREYQILNALAAEHQATAKRVDLAAVVSLSPSGVTRALRPLEKLGYVETRRDARDARSSLARLTAHGKKLVREASQIFDEVITDQVAIQGLGTSERQDITSFLRQLSG